jgi:hypothetical protein
MDYGALADLETEPVTIEIESADSLQRRVEGLEHFYPEDAVRLRTFGSKAVLLPQHVEVVTLARGKTPRIVVLLEEER